MKWLTSVLSGGVSLLAVILVVLVLAFAAGCSLFTEPPVAVPRAVAEALSLPVEVEGPHKGQAVVPAERVPVVLEDFRAVQAKKEEDAEAARGEAAAAAERKTAAALVEVEQSVRRTQRRHTSALSALTLAQEEELEALGAGHSAKLASIAAAAEKARDAAERTLRGVRDETAAAERQVVYNVEVQRAANERRLGLLSGAVDLANGAAVTAGGPGGVAAVAGLGLLAGWLGLSKPGDKKAAAEADKVRATLVNVARAVELLPPEKRADTKAAIDKTTTDADDLLIDRLKVDFAIRPAA